MTQPQSFFASQSSMSDDDLQLKIREPIVAAAMIGMLLSGCSTKKNNRVVPPSNAMNASQDTATTTSSVVAQNSSSSSSMSSSAAIQSSTMSASAQSSVAQRHKYKDGTFSAAGDYLSPSGGEEINVSLTIKSGVITDATYEGTADGGKSQKMQAAFGEGYKELVLGKAIDEVTLDVVNGSSLTPIGFMDAVRKIKVEAAAA